MDDEGRLDRRILAAVTRRGRRLLTLVELREEGATYRIIDGRIESGVWQRVHPKVVLVGTGDLTWQERILGGVLAGGPSARATDLAALRLFDLGTFGPAVLDVLIPNTTEATAAGITFRRTRRMPPSSIVQSVPCVCVEHALLDAAVRLPSRQLHQAFTTAWRRRLTTPKKTLLHVERFGGRGVRGSARLREVAALYESYGRGPGSEAEAHFVHDFFAELDARGIERPELQFAISVHGGTATVVPDFVWPQRWKVIEMMGLKAHGNYFLHDDDVERAAAIRAAGWDLAEVTPRAMRERRKQTIARLIRFLETP